MRLGIVILAAGRGTRMKSSLPKVLHPLAGRPLLGHVLATAAELNPDRIIVVHGHGGSRVRDAFADSDIHWVEQREQKGTGHALQQALPVLDGMDRVLVLYADVPLIRADSLRSLLESTRNGLALLTVEREDPRGYGRILRDEFDSIQGIVEQKDASVSEQQIREINTGIMALPGCHLGSWLSRLSSNNAQGEYYLTDVVAMAVADGIPVVSASPLQDLEAEGVNDRVQLARLERRYQQGQAESLMRAGVSLRDPARFDLRGELQAGEDVSIDVNVILEGKVILGDGVSIGANSVLRDVRVGAGVQIRENCVLEDADIGSDCRIGPFARIRPGTELADEVHLGNFVEIKNSRIDDGAKVNHLSYVGDSDVGAWVNIGAGTITCNYDGANKHRTIIGDRAFIGSNTALVAPVTVGEEATIGAGSVIGKSAPAGKLTISRPRQITLDGWKRPVRKKDG